MIKMRMTPIQIAFFLVSFFIIHLHHRLLNYHRRDDCFFQEVSKRRGRRMGLRNQMEKEEEINPHRVGSTPWDTGSHMPSIRYIPQAGLDLICPCQFDRPRWGRSQRSFHNHCISRCLPLGTYTITRNFEIRISKSGKNQNFKAQKHILWDICILSLFRISCLGFRIYY